jgi:hypothetical protein
MFEVIELNESKNLMKSTNVIIYGTIRDIEEHFIKSFTNIDLLCSFFNNVYIIIFENDSLDNTRNLLTNWSLSSNTNIIKHIILENNLNSRFPHRAHRLTYCRNQILNYIFDNNLNKSYQYVIHCDLDDRFWALDYDSICNCFQYDLNSWDAMFPVNTNYSYYDFWALRCNETWFNKNIFCCEIENNEKYNEFENHVPDFCSFLKKNKNTLINVNSAFNGIGIYKISSLNNCRYDASYFCNKCKGQKFGCLEDNDHIGLHKSMISNNCKLFINTKMILENKNKEYISFAKFIENLKNIPNIKKDPLKYVLYTKKVEQDHLWLNFSNKLGNYENIISNFTTNNITTFCIHDNNFYTNNLINSNVIKYVGHLSKNIYQFILNNNDSLISFIHIDFNNYHDTKNMFDKLYKKIKNNCIIVINHFINYNEYLLNDLHAFYEFTQKYNIKFEYIGIDGDFFVNPNNISNCSTNVAIKIINNPCISTIEITSDFLKYDDVYIHFDWIKYIEKYSDLSNSKSKEETWEHWINYGKKEGRQYFIKETEKNTFDWMKYIEKYPDLSSIKTEEEAWNHWINYGKNEGRQYFKKEIQINDTNNRKDTNDTNNTNNTNDTNDTNDTNSTIEYENKIFNWKKYVDNNKDLENIKTKEEAWNHWINHGKNEGRQCYKKSKYDEKKNFDWKYYVENNEDLKYIRREDEAWEHWINYGKNEGRNSIDSNFIKIYNFDWRYYIENNPDLKDIKTKEDAWGHWFSYGRYENRLFKKKLKKVEYIF